MISFIKPEKPDVALFNQLLTTSIDRNHYTNFGPNCKKLEEKFIELTGITKVILTANATVALEGLHALLSHRCGIAYLPSFTFPATNQGCQTSFIYGPTISGGHNIGRSDWGGCNDFVGSYAVTVNPFGSINPVCKKPRVLYWVVDNAAGLLDQAQDWLGAGADVVVYSLHATKILSACEGGVIFFNNSILYEEYKEYMNFGFKLQSDGSRTVGVLGSNHKMSELSAAWCLMSLENLDAEISKRKNIADIYETFCRDNEIIYIPSLQAFWLLGKEDSITVQRFGAMHDIDFRPYYQKLPLDNSGCQITELFTTKGFCLPTRGTLTEDELNHVVDILQKAKSMGLI